VDFSEARDFFGIIFQFQGPLCETMECRSNSKKLRASLQNSWNNRFPDLIFNGKFYGPSPRCVGPRTAPVHGGPWIEGTAAPRRHAARGRWSSLVLAGD
jgi:hypothetical protein